MSHLFSERDFPIIDRSLNLDGLPAVEYNDDIPGIYRNSPDAGHRLSQEDINEKFTKAKEEISKMIDETERRRNNQMDELIKELIRDHAQII